MVIIAPVVYDFDDQLLSRGLSTHGVGLYDNGRRGRGEEAWTGSEAFTL